jgi:hypothetical protein
MALSNLSFFQKLIISTIICQLLIMGMILKNYIGKKMQRNDEIILQDNGSKLQKIWRTIF